LTRATKGTLPFPLPREHVLELLRKEEAKTEGVMRLWACGVRPCVAGWGWWGSSGSPHTLAALNDSGIGGHL
jgi:hypothetical protein